MSKKSNLPENIKKLKETLETGNNLVDHFLLCGVEPNICKDEDLYDLSNEKYLDFLEKKFLNQKFCRNFLNLIIITILLMKEYYHIVFRMDLNQLDLNIK